MPRQRDPRFAKRLVGRRLRALRDGLGRTQQDVADSMDWSVSKLIRIENSSVGVSTSDLKALMLEYGVAEDEAATLIAVAKDSRRDPWYARYGDAVDGALRKLLAYEGSAVAAHQFQLEVVPGLLQTEEYARALLTLFLPADLVESAVAARMERQRHFFDDDAPDLTVVLWEAVLAPAVGGAPVMAGQLEHLLTMMNGPKVSIEVVPFSVGAHVGLEGSFTLLDLDVDADADTVLYVEGREDYLTNRDDELVAPYWTRFDALRKVAETSAAATAMLERHLSAHQQHR
ncbi:helix-turn-helix domain-containing protein [Actinophytocola oryzae]|uniref:Helix-turn-helix protein n=1 Tax=Actinophytocola oryzae TaxID=502181 RepID=A0A4R7UQG7_9PSEU|nr:helix-turn-helix transcriptional regulator [Actinophytocola oryzae]TDV36639.1 helix-turn-helix protein [Actinophytocola oryzae]